MYGGSKRPRDPFRYPRSPDSHPLASQDSPGWYVFVVDVQSVIHVAPNRLHEHPKVLGGCRPALYAGELWIDRSGSVGEVNNLSGTFQFRSRKSLCGVVESLRQLGFTVGRVVWYPPDGMSAPRVLQCP
jgi:hypothetical protein